MRPNGSPHVLVANDSPDILALFEEALEEEGYRVTTRATLPSVEDVVAHEPDLLILDYVWGGADAGWVLLERLREDGRTRSLPIILCTGLVRQLDPVREWLEARQVVVVAKPFDIDALAETVAAALGTDRVA